jgi:predicted esterase
MDAARHSAQSTDDPHANQSLMRAGPLPEHADATLVLLHGRGGTAEGMVSLFNRLGLSTVAALAPQAANHTWYPHTFLAPIEDNEPFLSSALKRVESIVSELAASGIKSSQIALLGFSQGACLATEFVARHPRFYGAVIAFTGGLIGPLGTPRNYSGSLEGTPIYLGTSDPDPHVPFTRVQETEAVLSAMGAKVELRRFPEMPHTINQEELDAARDMLENITASSRRSPP